MSLLLCRLHINLILIHKRLCINSNARVCQNRIFFFTEKIAHNFAVTRYDFSLMCIDLSQYTDLSSVTGVPFTRVKFLSCRLAQNVILDRCNVHTSTRTLNMIPSCQPDPLRYFRSNGCWSGGGCTRFYLPRTKRICQVYVYLRRRDWFEALKSAGASCVYLFHLFFLVDLKHQAGIKIVQAQIALDLEGGRVKLYNYTMKHLGTL